MRKFFPFIREKTDTAAKYFHRNSTTYSFAHEAMNGSAPRIEMPIWPENMTKEEEERFDKVMEFLNRTATTIVNLESFEESSKNYHALKQKVLDLLFMYKPDPEPSFVEQLGLVSSPVLSREYSKIDNDRDLDALVIVGLALDSVRNGQGMIESSGNLYRTHGNIPLYRQYLVNSGPNSLDSLYNPNSKLELRTFENA